MADTIVASFAEGRWHVPTTGLVPIHSAIDGSVVAHSSSAGLDFAAAVRHARKAGKALRAMGFQKRAAALKVLGQAILAQKEALYELSFHTGATRKDSWIDIEGGAGTLLSYASKGRRELPDGPLLLDGEPETLGRAGQFLGQHVFTPLQGVAVLINAYNFPVWGMLEKLAPCLLAGVPAIVKPAGQTGYVAAAAFRILLDTGALPEGALQLVSGSAGDLLDHLGGQDCVAFTGSARTAQALQAHSGIIREAVRFSAERDSLNGSVLAPDARPGTPEFDLFVREVVREMTAKAGQKCTAIRRAFVPAALLDPVQAALVERLGRVMVGDPRLDATGMGALVSQAQRNDVRHRVAELARHAAVVFGDPAAIPANTPEGGAFMAPVLLRADAPWADDALHAVEAFGPVATLMPYADPEEAVALANHGKGSLVISVFTHDPAFAAAMVVGAGSFHGRMAFIDRDCAAESTGHGSPLPMLTHGGPGRAGGGEELGGLRGMKHFMQRTALQGSPALLASVTGEQMPGAPVHNGATHPFRLRFGELHPGIGIRTDLRRVELDDIEHFAHFTGDTFYAHMDEEAAARSPIFGGRVAHGYLILAFAAGLFVDPAPGPVLANYGLEGLRFVKPVKPGTSIRAQLTVKSKKLKTPEMGEVRWSVAVTDETDALVATYDLLTMNAL